MQNGKSCFGSYLAKKLGWEEAAFALAVKNIFCNSFGLDMDFIEEWKVKSEIPEGMLKPVRQSLQFIGQGFREIKPSVWVDIALKDETKKLVFEDGRYFSEAKSVKEKGGINIVLFRPGFLNDDPNASEAEIRPILEWCDKTQKDGKIILDKTAPIGMENYHLFIRNDGLLEDLYHKINNIVIPYIKEKLI